MPVMPMGDDLMGILLYDMPRGGVGAAIVKGPNHKPSKDGVKVYLNANPDLNMVLERVPAAGGSIVMEKTPIGDGMGYFAGFADTEGNTIWLHSME
jgi:predicted enzyme related to lactoylglutathione lyase